MTGDIVGGHWRDPEVRKAERTPGRHCAEPLGGQGEDLGLTLPKGGGRADPTGQTQVEMQRKRPGGDQ